MKRIIIIIIATAILLVYLTLNIIAIDQLVIPLNHISDSLANLRINNNLTTTRITSAVTIRNPTFIPVIVTGIDYELDYGDIKIGTGFSKGLLIMPFAEKTIIIDFQVDNKHAVLSIIEGISNIILNENKKITIKTSADFGPISTTIPIDETLLSN